MPHGSGRYYGLLRSLVCPDCRQSKQLLGEQRVPYNWVDIDQDEEGRRYVQQVNDGKQIIPTVVFKDGSILVEPSNAELAAKLGIKPKAERIDNYPGFREGVCGAEPADAMRGQAERFSVEVVPA